jgi:hypothetical protein
MAEGDNQPLRNQRRDLSYIQLSAAIFILARKKACLDILQYSFFTGEIKVVATSSRARVLAPLDQ